MMYIAITPYGKQFPRNIVSFSSKHALMQVVKDTIYSGRCDLADLPYKPNKANIKQLLAILDRLDGEQHTKTTRQAYLKFHKERQA